MFLLFLIVVPLLLLLCFFFCFFFFFFFCFCPTSPCYSSFHCISAAFAAAELQHSSLKQQPRVLITSSRASVPHSGAVVQASCAFLQLQRIQSTLEPVDHWIIHIATFVCLPKSCLVVELTVRLICQLVLWQFQVLACDSQLLPAAEISTAVCFVTKVQL